MSKALCTGYVNLVRYFEDALLGPDGIEAEFFPTEEEAREAASEICTAWEYLAVAVPVAYHDEDAGVTQGTHEDWRDDEWVPPHGEGEL